MLRDHSEDLIKKHGFEKGLDLLNVITAHHLGLIPQHRAVHFVHENLSFFADESPPPLQDLK